MLNDSLKRFLKDEGGQSIIEYSLLLVLIAGISLVVLTMMGVSISRVLGMHDITWAYAKYHPKK